MSLTSPLPVLMIPSMNSMTIYALGKELNELLPGTILERTGKYPGFITFHLNKGKMKFIHLFTFRREPSLILHHRSITSSGYSREILGDLGGAEIEGVESLGMDRFLLFHFKKKTGWDNLSSFILRLNMTPHGETATLFRGKEIADFIGTRGSSPPPYPGHLPVQKPLRLTQLPPQPTEDIISERDSISIPAATPDHTREWRIHDAIPGILVNRIEGLDPFLAEQITRFHQGDLKKIWVELLKLGSRISADEFEWCMYTVTESDRAKNYYLYPARIPGKISHLNFGSFREAGVWLSDNSIIPEYTRHLRKEVISGIKDGLKKDRKLLKNLSRDKREAEKANEYRHLGNLLAANRHLMKKGDSSITVKDFSGSMDVDIPLEPSRTPDENIKSYFRKAKKGERGLLIINNRRKNIQRELERKQRLIQKINNTGGTGRLLEMLPVKPERKKSGIPGDKKRKFRRYRLDDKHIIYVGRNAAENDRLTHQFASKRDLWLHARSVPGSHVILKGYHRSTPRSIIHRAASIAAWFSAARNSATVPVVYTEKRYVRKPRKSPPGTATLIRGETVFVSPSPPGGEK